MAASQLQDYLASLQREYRTGKAKEHGYRHALKALIKVPLMLWLVHICLRTRGWFARGA